MVLHRRSLKSLFAGDQNGQENSLENSGDSPRSSSFNDTKTTLSSSPKKSRRAIQKRVVSVPIRDVEGSRSKGETNTPPSDSWAWRKYGQKPIKGSPYPRGYYRCSSSKGCPARKQVERSRMDPTMVVVTYSSEHNHSWPASRSNNHHHNTDIATTTNEMESNDIATSHTDDQDNKSEELLITRKSEHDELEVKLSDINDGSLLDTNQFEWFSDLESSCSTMLESTINTADTIIDADMSMIFSIREEDESLFADLGELPECSRVFQQKVMEHRRFSLTPWCGTT